MPPIPLRDDFLFHVDHNTNTSMLETLDSSCSQVPIRNIISISLEIQLNIGPFLHGKPWQFYEMIPSVPIPILYYLFGQMDGFIVLFINHTQKSINLMHGIYVEMILNYLKAFPTWCYHGKLFLLFQQVQQCVKKTYQN